jgi:S1-C subfamily serine protease
MLAGFFCCLLGTAGGAMAQPGVDADEGAAQELAEARERMAEAVRDVVRLSSQMTRPWAEVRSRWIGSAPGTALGIAIDEADRGVNVLAVTPGWPAAAAGVRVGDRIIALDDHVLTDQDGGGAVGHLLALMGDVQPDQVVTLTVLRNGEEHRLDVTARATGGFPLVGTGQAGPVVDELQSLLERGGQRMGGLPGVGNLPGMAGRWRGLELVSLTPGLGEYFGTDQGLLVVRAPAGDELDLRDGDVILDIGGRVPTSPEHAMRILATFAPGETLRMGIMRQQRTQTLEIRLTQAGRR